MTRHAAGFEYWPGELAFQKWLIEVMTGQRWHCQGFDDRQQKGIPDMNAAHAGSSGDDYTDQVLGTRSLDAWIELKHMKGVVHADDRLHLEHPVTAQQGKWLRDRALRETSWCGVGLAWQIGFGQVFISFVPIHKWPDIERGNMWNMALQPYTAKVEWLLKQYCTIRDVIEARLIPGWGGRGPAPLDFSRLRPPPE